MNLSIITPTYNRANMLKDLYESIIKNLELNKDKKLHVEWLVMDDGSTDNTREIVKEFQTKASKENRNIEIKYFYQENQGKMIAINNLVPKVTGDYIIDCDSDDYFSDNAFEIMKTAIEENINEKDIYGLCFLKNDQNGNNMGNAFKKHKTTMFDLYFKEGETGEKAILFKSKIRKEYKHELENNEKFVTEARMYHKMDENYKMICINKPIMICEYQKEGYTKNIIKQFKENPYGYYKYFEEILKKDMKNVPIKKCLYAIKHFILFSYLTKQYKFKSINNFTNKMLYYMLLIPGIFKAKYFIKK